ncbi:MAG: 2-amino-4-hydroxy-6-hydroxymethyldihydropteridine diphosphokinase [Alphaproteobacteria bacterium]|jgi:2-amino-4-hydroxy-6-hydroxymethyldihydropteridine diphosphokinase
MILIALGSNLASPAGSPAETVRAALAALTTNGIAPVKVSRLYATQAWPNPADPPFVNAAAQVETELQPVQLLHRLQRIERSFGRERDGGHNAPRVLDLDILDYDGRVEGGPPTLPHPRIESRAFVLVPLAELAPYWRHPVSRRTAAELLVDLPDYSAQVRPLAPENGLPVEPAA